MSRLAALGLLATVLLLGWALAVEPYRALLAAQEAGLAERRERLERLSRIADGVPALTRALEAASAGPTLGDPYLAGATDALAAATLHGRLGRMAEASGVAMVSVEPLAATEAAGQGAPGSGRVALAVTASGPLDGVQRLLYAVETERPLLFVEELELTNPSVVGLQMTPVGQPVVSLRLRVAGYRRTSS